MKKNVYVKSIAGSVDEYLNALPAIERNTLEKFRQSIKAAAPKAEEVISYRIPAYKYKGSLVHFMAGGNHCSFITVSKSQPEADEPLAQITEIFKKELQSFKTSGTTIHFTPGKPLPAALIKKIVKERIKENEKGAKN